MIRQGGGPLLSSHGQQYGGGDPTTSSTVVAGYRLTEKLGSGSFAVVYKGELVTMTTAAASSSLATAAGNSNNSTTRLLPLPSNQPSVVAIKAISLTSDRLTKKVLANLQVEIAILQKLQHDNIVRMTEAIQSMDQLYFYMVLEYCAGGDVQNLIRSRQHRRLSERLVRRLLRDLANGLSFLWHQELIHRDIKPQNLLLTTFLPYEELMENPSRHDLHATTNKDHHDDAAAPPPPTMFALKIADFGFARHLQSTSLAETLCGSPLYMAPEILQHQRYDSKADLWSVGTVLFEMITGQPPFSGENHIDLLHNIQRKAVRLPKDVSVSKECVNLLRILLCRNPLKRAGFAQFFAANEAFVALGCNGEAASPVVAAAAGGGVVAGGSTSMTTADHNNKGGTTTSPFSQRRLSMEPIPENEDSNNNKNTAIVGATTTSTALSKLASPRVTHLIPPTQETTTTLSHVGYNASAAVSGGIGGALSSHAIELPTRHHHHHHHHYTTNNNNEMLQNSTDDGSFVMVEATTTTPMPPVIYESRRLAPSPPAGFFASSRPLQAVKGMLSTSPGTGGLLLGQRGGAAGGQDDRPTTTNNSTGFGLVVELKELVKRLATAEDIGRRAVCVAHLGDLCARRAMARSGSSSLDEDDDDDDDDNVLPVPTDTTANNNDNTPMDDDEMPFALQTETTSPATRAIMSTQGLMPSRATVSFHKGDVELVERQQQQRWNPETTRKHLLETLTCYVKAMTMLKGAVGVLQTVTNEVDQLLLHLSSGGGNSKQQQQRRNVADETTQQLQQVKKRTEVTRHWLASQFKCLLERGEATNTELNKLPTLSTTVITATTGGAQQQPPPSSFQMPNTEEILYNHSLAFGREGAAKQLLGQYESARLCYRSAGLLTETLLMEPRVQGEDRKTLEMYVNGFAAQIREIDDTMMQMSQNSSASTATATTTTSRHVTTSSRQRDNVLIHTPTLPAVHPFASLPTSLNSK